LKRRQAIKHLGVGFSSAVIGASWLSSCHKNDPTPEVKYDGNVIVIGAGPAGLYAADILITKGLNVTVLEASAKVGGRVSSLRNQEDQQYQSIGDFPIELGAEYFQGLDSVFGKLVQNLNLPTVELTDEAKRYMLGNVVKSESEWASDGDFAAVKAFVNGIKTYTGPAVTMKEAAGGMSESALTLLNALCGNFYGSSSDRVGIKGISEQLKLVTHDEKFYTLKANTMQDLFISRFSDVYPKVQLNSPVKSINYSADPVIITLEDGTQITANKVVVTVPVTILKNGITFSPGLPGSMTSALARIGMDPSMRVILDFKKNFWGEDSSFIWGGSVAPQSFSAGFGRSESIQTMSVTINGQRAVDLSNMADEDTIAKAILTELDKAYAGQATKYIRTVLPDDADPTGPEKMVYVIKDWTKEKYIQGGFSYPMVSTSLDDRMALLKPINDRLFIAGEATDISGDAGTLSGAMTSAERVADDVVQSILKVS
jgi:monoamine oxidase